MLCLHETHNYYYASVTVLIKYLKLQKERLDQVFYLIINHSNNIIVNYTVQAFFYRCMYNFLYSDFYSRKS